MNLIQSGEVFRSIQPCDKQYSRIGDSVIGRMDMSGTVTILAVRTTTKATEIGSPSNYWSGTIQPWPRLIFCNIENEKDYSRNVLQSINYCSAGAYF
jgi:hypothetical protein